MSNIITYFTHKSYSYNYINFGRHMLTQIVTIYSTVYAHYFDNIRQNTRITLIKKILSSQTSGLERVRDDSQQANK